jgi:hypothetical protein
MLLTARIIAMFAVSSLAYGQWINYKAPGVVRKADGKPNLTAATPRVNGKPDFSGIWMIDAAGPGEIDKMIPGIGILAVPGDDPAMLSKYFMNVLADYKPDQIKLSADAQKAMRSNGPPNAARCLPAGTPMADQVPLPKRFVQTNYMVAIIYESDLPRQIYTDGRPLPVDPQPAWRGYSVGKWENDTLVVETIGLLTTAPLDGFNHPKSPAMRIVERFNRTDYGHMKVQVTVNDPTYYSKPFSYTYTQTLVPDDDLLEYICIENEKDVPHLSSSR